MAVSTGRTVYRVEGLRELLRVTDEMGKDVKRGVRDELRKVAEPIKDEANRLFMQEITPDQRHGKYGVSVRKSGVVSVEQRVKSRYSRQNPKLKRPKFTSKQWDEVLGPAADEHQGDVDTAMNNVIDRLERIWLVGA